MLNDPKNDVIEKIKSVISSYNSNPNISERRKAEVELLKDKLDLITICHCSEGVNINEGKSSEKSKRKNKRLEFMGTCMRSVVKGGEGKNMKACSDKWNVVKEKVKNNE